MSTFEVGWAEEVERISPESIGMDHNKQRCCLKLSGFSADIGRGGVLLPPVSLFPNELVRAL